MNLPLLLNELSSQGVQLSVKDESLVVKAPKGTLTPQHRQALATHKAQLLLLLEHSNRSQKGASQTLLTLTPAPEKRHTPFPMTDMQHAFWVGRSGGLELGGVANHGYYEIEQSTLDVARLNGALQRLIQRHEMLRAVVLPDGQQQVLAQVPPYEMQVLDLRNHSEESVVSQLAEIREQLSHQVLPTDQYPLFEFRATHWRDEKTGDRTRLHISYDLQIFDAWSLFRLFDEWFQLYTQPDLELPPLELSFRDYVLAEQALEDTELYRRSQAYWHQHIDTLPPAPELPLARHPQELKKHRCRRYEKQLTPEVWQQLKQYAAQAGLTPSGVLLAAFADVLALWNKTPSFTLNVALFNRLPLHPQVNDILGDFSSVTLLGVDHTMPSSFKSRAQNLQTRLWQDLDHRYMSGVKVVRELSRRQGSLPSAMPVVFTSTLGFGSIGQETLTFSHFGDRIYGISQASQTWMDVQVWEEKGCLSCNWDVVEGLFPEGLIQEMFEAYWSLLQQLTTSSLAWSEVSSQSKLPPKQQIQRYITNTTVAPISEQLIHSLFAKQAQARGNNLAVITTHCRLTYRELFERANRLGHRLRRLGVSRGQLVAVVMDKGWEQVVAALAVLNAGAAYVPIDPEQPAERMAGLLKDSGVVIALTQSWLNTTLTWPLDLQPSLQRICLDSEDLSAESSAPLAPVQAPDDLAYVLYTSGSTGKPKGVMLSHRGVVNAITATNRAFKISPQDRGLALTALHHDMSIFDLFGLLAAGAALVIPDAAARKDPGHWQQLMRQEQVTLWNSVPAMMEMLLAYGETSTETLSIDKPPVDKPSVEKSSTDKSPIDTQLSSLRLAFLGGDWISTTLPDRLKGFAPTAQVVSVGGPTETTLWNIWYPVETVDPNWKSIPYGKPIANTQYYVLNEQLEDCPTWVPGELCCSGVGLAKGYWQDPDKTQAKFITHPRTGDRMYRTGDIGRYLPSGDIEFLGRADFQVKIQGQRIELGEIEAALQQEATVRSAVVVALKEGTSEGASKVRLVAYVIPEVVSTAVVKTAVDSHVSSVRKEPSQGLSQELSEVLSEKLPTYMQPTAIIVLDQWPLSANGKVDRKALLARAHDEVRTLNVQPVAPQNQLEKTLAAVWQDILAVEQVGVLDNFFDLGGNSLLITQVYRELSSVLPPLSFRPPTLLDLFKYSTIRDLAGYLSVESSTAEVATNLDLDESLNQRLSKGKNRLRQQRHKSTVNAGKSA